MTKHYNPCIVVKTTLSIIFTVVMVAALLGAYKAHIGLAGPVFGTTEGSLSILAVVLTLMYWTKHTDASGILHPRYQQGIVLVILILASVASVIGVFQAHVKESGFTVGTVESTLSILAFAVAAKHWAKHVQWICKGCRI